MRPYRGLGRLAGCLPVVWDAQILVLSQSLVLAHNSWLTIQTLSILCPSPSSSLPPPTSHPRPHPQVELRARRLLSELDSGARHVHSAEEAEHRAREDAEKLLVISMVSWGMAGMRALLCRHKHTSCC